MASSKKINNLSEVLIFIFLILFPFGQIIRLSLNIAGQSIVVQPVDVIAGLGFVYFLFEKISKPKIFKLILSFIGVAFFSYALSYGLFSNSIFTGGLYLMRLIAYSAFFVMAWNFAKDDRKYTERLFNSLIIVVLAVAVFGGLQYLLWPDTTSFAAWGWDDHYYRLLSTFLDPGYTSIILSLGFLGALVSYLEKREKKLIFALAVILIALAFTYSRAGYLALAAGVFMLSILKKNLKIFVFTISILILLVISLPRPGGEGVKLERTSSIALRIVDYKDTLNIFKRSPVLGIGYNNMCLARQEYLHQYEFDSHACSGSASSLLLIMATTGIVGLTIFVTMIYGIVNDLAKNKYGITFLTCLMALLVHSLFVNSLFYSWIMGWMALLLAISLRPLRSKGD